MTGSIDPGDHDDPAVRCRTVGHAWDPFVPVGMRRPSFGARLSLLCGSCGTERHDLVNAAGDVLAREYRYRDGYQIAGGAPDRADWRREYVARTPDVARADDVDAGSSALASRDDLWGRS